MAYLDIAAANSYGRYNIKFAGIVGLNSAVYWSCLMNIAERVMEKGTYDAQGFFSVNRAYVEKQTTLTKDQQLECDETLKKIGIVESDPKNSSRLRCGINKFIAMIVEDDIKTISEISKVAKSATKAGKAEGKKIGIIHRLQASLVETDVDLLQAYKDWIEACYEKGLTSVPQVKVFVESVEKYSDEKDVKLDVIKTATSLAYREAAWAIQMYEKNRGSKSTRINSTQKKSIGTLQGESF